MLTQDRHCAILNLLKTKSSVTLLELTTLLNTSESTIRRDLTALDKAGKLRKFMAEQLALIFILLTKKTFTLNMIYKITEKNLIAKKSC